MNRFQRAMGVLAAHEGGYVDHPHDPGGATNRGVTQRVYDLYRQRRKLETHSVKGITNREVEAIYRRQYWGAISAKDLPEGVAYCVFDAAVNSGAARAVKWMQEIVGVQVDGIVGNETISAVRTFSPSYFIDKYCDRRLTFMKSLKHWSHFKDGWTRRVAEVRAQSKAWAGGGEVEKSQAAQIAKAEGPKGEGAALMELVKDGSAMTKISGVLGGAGTLASYGGPIQWAIAAAIFMGVAYFIYAQIKERES